MTNSETDRGQRERDERLDAAALRQLRLDDEFRAAAPSESDEAWLADPLNRGAMDDVAHAWNVFEEHAAAPEVMALRRDALSRAQRNAQRRWQSAAARRWAVAAAVLLAVVLGV